MRPPSSRRWLDKAVFAAVTGVTLAVTLVFAAFFGGLVVHGFFGLRTIPRELPPESAWRWTSMLAGSAKNTVVLVTVAGLIASPFAVAVGFLLSEGRDDRFLRGVRACARAAQGVPSVIVGVGVSAAFVTSCGLSPMAAGAIALALMLLPGMILTTESLARAVPNDLRSAAFALGASRLSVLLGVVLPGTRTAIIAAIVSALIRGVGEAAVLLVTMGTAKEGPLAVLVYHESLQFDLPPTRAHASALIMMVFILSMHLVVLRLRSGVQLGMARW